MSNTTEDVTSGDNDDNLPEIYVDEHILKPIVLDCIREDHKIQPIYDKVYEINGTIFREDVWEDEGTLSVFEIHTTNTVNGETEVTIHEATDIHLPICIQETPYGLIINSNVLLTVNQWNTLVDQDDTHKCIVCDTKVDGTIEHIESDTHLRNLEKYQPLQQFDLSITRLIDDMYHCGVCNECFATNADNEHFDSQTHEERMLFATNRVSDVMYDFNLYDQNRNSDNGNTDNGNKNNDCYHFNRNRILSLSDTSGFDSAEGFYDYDFDDNVPCVSEIDNESNDNECSGNDNEGNVIDNNEYNAPNYVSYASIAKKVEATPNYVYVTIFDKKMKMKFDHWHMISTFKSYKTNQLYCMVCKKYWPITQKALHCAKKAHLDKLKCYKFVEEYKNYFIRKIDFKYYHCGLCNNIQLVDEMSQHITAKHKKNAISALHSEVAPKKSKNNDDSAKNTRNTINDVTLPLLKEPQTIRNTDETLLDTENENNGNLATIANTTNDDQTFTAATNTDNETAVNARNVDNDSPALKYQDNDNEYVINNESPSIYNDVIINQYGFRIRVSFISYNVVVKRQSDYNCLICYMEACDADIKCHIQDPNHIGRLRCIPFLDSYGIHLIRMVGSLSHCTVCNVAFNSGQTKEHTLTADHIKMLSKGLAINNFQDHQNRDFRMNLNQHSIPPLALGVNQHAMRQPAMAMNQPPIPAPIMGMNQWPTLPPTIRMNQPPMIPPRIGTPTINMHQRPMHLPTIGTQPGPSGMVSNQPNTYKNQTKTDMKQHASHPRKHSATNLTTTYINQRTTSMPNLDIDQSNIGMNQPATIEPNNDKNQDQSDMNQSKKGTNQRATNQFKMEDDLCTVESTMQDMLDSNLNESFEDVDDDLEYFKESFVYLKFKKTFIQVGLASYNSLIMIGDGTAHCFVCSLRVYGSMKGHIDSKAHADNMEQCKFVSKYDRHLLRQMFLNYHCSICNVVFTRKDINKHIVWPLHAQDNKTAKKARQRDLKSGNKPLNINFQNETIYLNEKEPEIKVLLKVEIRANCQGVENLQKKNKIIIHDKNVLKISWDAYHGLCKNKSGHRCVLCQSDVRGYELSAHIGGEYHRELLDKFQTQHLPHLLREINETTVNCVICNAQVANKEHIIADHVNGKKHKRTYEAILVDSGSADGYADCNHDVLNL